MTTKATAKLHKTKLTLNTRLAKGSRVLSDVVVNKANQIAQNPKKAKAFLERAGIITKSGNLTSHYK